MEDIKVKSKKIRKYIKKTAIILALVVLAVFVCNLRCEYLEYKEIGENFVNVFWTNTMYGLATGIVNFIIVFFSLFITTKLIHKGLKPFFIDEKKEIVRLPNKSISFIIALISSCLINYFIKDKLLLFVNNSWFRNNRSYI